MSIRIGVNIRQREMLVQFMERFPPLALGIMKGKEDFVKSRLMWDKIARHLNKIDPRVIKSGKNWNRYWSDIKFKVRRKYATILECQKLGKNVPQLSELEERMKNLLTDNKGKLINTGHERVSNLRDNFVILDKKDEDTDVKDYILTNSNDESTFESTDQCVTMNFDEDGKEVTLPTEYITLEESHYILDNNLEKNIKTEQKTIEDLKKELLEFQLHKQKELFKIEKQQRIERHKIEMDILHLRKETLKKQLERIYK